MTTGSLDSAAAPGNIDKVQLKAGTATRNFNGLAAGGVFTQTFTGLGRNEPLQIQTNVSGIDGSRTDVVTVTEAVKLRPDVAVERIVVQPHAAVGVPLQVSAFLHERNGDVGARANCVLLAGGVEADRAEGIWVDANGSVTCQFLTTFEATGDQQLEVALTDVSPGDYDDANNRASASVRVYAETTDFPSWWAGAGEQQWETTYSYHSYYQHVDGHDVGWATGTNFNVNIMDPGAIQTWLALRLSYQESTDGRQVVDIPDAAWTFSGDCAVAVMQGTTLEKCVIRPGRRGPSMPVLQIRASRGGGAATYRSHGWYLSYNASTGQWDRYTTNQDTYWPYGERIELGDTVAMTVRASDGTTMWEAQPFITLTPNETSYSVPYSCYTDWNGTETCTSNTYRNVARSGGAFGGEF